MSSGEQIWTDSIPAMPPLAHALRWYAIQTWPRHEKKVDGGLRGVGITAFLPLVTEIHGWRCSRLRVSSGLSGNMVRALRFLMPKLTRCVALLQSACHSHLILF